MGDQVDNKFTWVIKNVSSLPSEKIYSDSFVIGGCSWRLVATYFKRNIFNDSLSLSLSLAVADAEYLPFGWKRHAEFSFTIVNQISEEFSQVQDIFRDFTETQEWFDHRTLACGCASSFPLAKLDAKYGGFILNEQVKIVAEVKVLVAIGKSDEADKPLKKIKIEYYDFLSDTPPVVEEPTIVYGFPVVSPEVELVSRIFENHPDVASGLRKDMSPYTKRAHMYSLICVIETLNKPLQEISRSYLVDARDRLVFLRSAGLLLDWVEKKLDEVTEKMDKEEQGQGDI
ncbi:unnamed protein product [Arabidopsis lyrata]|uniref:MATH domain-containing protein n=1 Tax=Arabidopsis lyrata subsp. lyrata TaxID=81972 RepID=D7MB57_ARALL|nr:MATH domain and coiled-coil domain-containing protein At3g58200 [Arabidopsis lyrata subsp. lyrata]EFH43556.1 hypothetical protein ARALYDRAFT_913318 [Arabidopsis lyrata subsp. lyrata]CAH8274704.1 unnamed protein product [Arabidopsis lyrata]|eukprot:XP_002867297.1 MATH domain and coiled-coil domain-containing protein At3g58200 [Arabidopsis lyrata subsp. lyrata]